MTTKKTFLKLDPEFCAEETAFFHILPIPYEGAVSFLGGAARGPDAILDVSDQMEYIDERYKKPFWSRGVYTHEPIPPADSPEQEVARIEQVARRLDLFRPERLPIALGGDHSVSAPLIRVAAEKYPKLSVLQFDAHSDLRDSYEPGGKNSHASVMARALEVVDAHPRLPAAVNLGLVEIITVGAVEIAQGARRLQHKIKRERPGQALGILQRKSILYRSHQPFQKVGVIVSGLSESFVLKTS